MLVNNIVSESYYYGLNLVDGYMYGYVLNTGYYGNYLNKNWEFEETDPVIATEFPYIIGEEPLELCFLDQSCPFIDAGLGDITENAQLICSTTSLEENVDADTTDIGFHYPNFETVRTRGDFDNNNNVNANDIDLLYVEIKAGTNNPIYDLTNDGLVNKNDMDYIIRTLLGTEYGDANLDSKVDNIDLGILSSNWLKSGQSWAGGNFNGDGLINFIDYALLAGNWLFEGEGPKEFAVEVSGDPNNLSDFIEIGISGYTDNTSQVFLFMDGEYIEELWNFGENIELESYAFSNGLHKLKAVSADYDGFIELSEILPVNFNNMLYSVVAGDQFHPDENYKYSGFYDGTETLDANLTNMYDQVIWSNSYSGENLNIVIPGANFGNEQFCGLTIAETESGMMVMAEATDSSSDVTIDLTKKFKETDWPAGAKMVIVLPDEDVFKARKPAILACAEACKNRGVSGVPLYGNSVTAENLNYLFPNAKYIYWSGHASSHSGTLRTFKYETQFCYRDLWKGMEGIQRTRTQLGNGRLVFSWTGGLPDNWDTRGFSLWSLGMYNQNNKKIVFIDGCLSALHSDMAEAYGIQPGDPDDDQIYIGWRASVLLDPSITEPGSITDGIKMFWEQMGQPNDNVAKVGMALCYTADHGDYNMRKALWGPNPVCDLNPYHYETSQANIWIWSGSEGLNNTLNPY